MRRLAVAALAAAAVPRLATSLSSAAHRPIAGPTVEKPLAAGEEVAPSLGHAALASQQPWQQRGSHHQELLQASASSGRPRAEERRRHPLAALSREGKRLQDQSLRVGPRWHSTQREAFIQSFAVVGVAELFDKTWFVAVICALNFGARVAFCGAFGALSLHTLVAAMLGIFISRFFAVSVLHFITAGIFSILAGLYAYEWTKAEPRCNALEGRSVEAKDALNANAPSKEGSGENIDRWKLSLTRCFMAVFVAEWGDRTQIAMISLHSSFPVLPVCLGSLAAFFVLTITAVLVASLLEGQQLSERLVLSISAASFLFFALLSIIDGVHAMRVERLG